MSVAIQIRDVPESIRDVLQHHAREANMSLSAYLRTVLEREATRPTRCYVAIVKAAGA